MQAVSVTRPDRVFAPVNDTSDLRRELLNMAEPVIADRIIDGYRGLHQGEDAAERRFLAAQHRRLWRAILLDHRSLMVSLSVELRNELAVAGIRSEAIEEVDQSVLEELVDIVLRCFHFSHEKARQGSMILLDAASFIGATRASA